MRWLIHLFALLIGALLVVLGYYYIEFVRALVSALNERIVEALLGSSSWGVAIFMRPVLNVGLLIIEGLVAALILAACIEAPFKGKVSRETLRLIAMVAAFSAGPLFASHAFSILWGDVSIFGIVLVKHFDPERLTFALGVGLGMVAVWYVAADLFPFVFRPSTGTIWPVVSILSSLLPIIVIVAALGNYWFGSYPWTGYKLAALKVWGPLIPIDIAIISIEAWLLKRSLFGVEESVVR